DSLLFVSLEAADCHRDVVLSSQQIRKEEGSVGAGHRFARGIGARVLDDDRRPRKDAAARVRHDAGNLSGQSLCANGRRRAGDRDEYRDDEHDPEKTRCHVALPSCPAPSKAPNSIHPETPLQPSCPLTIRNPTQLPWRRGGYARQVDGVKRTSARSMLCVLNK